MNLSPPLPFLPQFAALRAWGFDQPHIDCSVADDRDEVLLEFMLYAQSRKRRWRMWAEYDNQCRERFKIRNLRVEFDAHQGCMLPSSALMSIGYCLVIVAHQPAFGLFCLDLPGISAFCRTEVEVLSAIDAVSPYVPETIRQFNENTDMLALEVHLWRQLHLAGGDSVLCAAIRRKMETIFYVY